MVVTMYSCFAFLCATVDNPLEIIVDLMGVKQLYELGNECCFD